MTAELTPQPKKNGLASSAAAFALTFTALAAAQLNVERPALMFERFLPGAGWAEIPFLAAWAAYLAPKFIYGQSSVKLRRRIWLLFSVVFFSQLALGLAGFTVFLMTGKLHFPIPALIIAGPVYRGEGFFMPILFLSTVALVGPAWCSHLCYFGAWDALAAGLKKRPLPTPKRRAAIRAGVLIAAIVVALLLRYIVKSTSAAIAAAAIFGLCGIAIIAVWSRRTGRMMNCVLWCPVGLAANLAGKINPFRISFGEGCTACGACCLVCRYDALNKADVERQKVGLTCSLCGDCIGACHAKTLRFTLLGKSSRAARAAFYVIVVSLHAVFLGLARI